MKRTLFFIVYVLASLTMSAQEELPVVDIQNSGCLNETRGTDSQRVPTIVLTKEGSALSVQLLNYEENCCTDDFGVIANVSGGSDGAPCSVSIIVAPSAEYDCNCICPYNVSFTLRDLEANTFYLKCWWYEGGVELTEGQSYQATYGGSFYSYHPFLKEGKTWNYQEYYHNVWDNQQWTKEVSYVINGTTEIDGKIYYKMYRISEDGNNYYCALREEDRKVWLYTSNEGDHLLYDFGMSVGDSYKPTYEPFLFQLTSIKPMRFHDDQLLNVFFYDMYNRYDPTESPINFAPVPIIEGVGCENGWNIVDFYADQPTNGIIYGERFLSCYEDGKCIFTADDFNNLTADINIAYRPFVEEGKVWKVGALYTGYPVQMVDYYYFDGDTIVDGKTCKQMMRQEYVNPDYAESHNISQDPSLSYVGAWYEEDKKVYEYDTTNKQFKLMYDFSLEDNGTFHKNDLPYVYVVGPRKTGGIKGFKGVYREVWERDEEKIYKCAPWLEGVGIVYGPPMSNILNVELDDPAWFLMECYVGDEVIYLNDTWEDGATPAEGRKRFDFTHTIKTQPKAPRRGPSQGEESQLYGEYNNLQLDINLDPLDDEYQVRITDESGDVVYEKTVDAGSIVGLNIDISAYPEGRYTVIVENSSEIFTGEFETQTTGIEENRITDRSKNGSIYNLQGQRFSSLQKGLNIVNGQKIYVK
ncbi:MAG: DUF3244 domain-containing protein [Prevotella sp.]|nr:DUF3244 domain-containing protein [Prevotella sp.]